MERWTVVGTSVRHSIRYVPAGEKGVVTRPDGKIDVPQKNIVGN